MLIAAFRRPEDFRVYQARSQDCQNEEADRSSVHLLPYPPFYYPTYLTSP